MTSQKFKFVPKIKTRSGKFFQKSAGELKKFILEKKCGYEIIDGACVPYYDHDKSFDSETEQKSAWETDLTAAFQKVSEKFPEAQVIVLDSSGSNTKKDKWVNSFHFVVRGAGFYDSGKAMYDAVGIEGDGWDKSVYKAEGKRQLFRLPYCSKEDDLEHPRQLKRVFIENDFSKIHITIIDTLNDIETECESLKDYLVSNVANETAMRPVVVQEDTPAQEAPDTTEEKNTKMLYPTMIPETNTEIVAKQYSGQDIRSLVFCLNPIGQKWTWEYWRDVMWVLRNIADEMKLPELRELAHQVSKENNLYNAEITNKIYDAVDSWDTEKKEGRLGIGSLIRLAKAGNPEQFIIWKNSLRQKSEVQKFSGHNERDYDIELLLSMFSDDDVAEYFVKTQGANYHVGIDGEIYHWEKHFWLKTDESVISIILSEVIYKAMKIKLDIHYDKSSNQKEYILLFKKISSLRNCKPRIGYIKAIIEKLRRKQFLNGENVEFDMKPDLLCFSNGVYDLMAGSFRDGKKSDFISNVIPYNWETSTVEEIDNLMSIISKIMPHEDERDCLLRAFSSTLTGRLLEYFLILTGAGRNGKDTLITGLLKTTLGTANYYNNDIKLLTNPSKSSISQEKANMNKKRAVIYAEPAKKDLLNCSTLKELRGCPELNARGIYSKNTVVHNHSTNILHCNSLPELDQVDDAIANSLVIFPFRALFRTKEKIAEYPEGTEFLHETDTYYKSPEFLEKNKLVFMNILLKYYKDFKAHNYQILNVPQTMIELQKSYLEDSDEFINWFEEKFEKTKSKDDFVKIGQDVHKLYVQSELYSNMTKREKRKANKKHLIKDIAENPNLKAYYRARINPTINAKQTTFTHVLLMYKVREDKPKDEFHNSDPYDSDDE